MLKLIEMNRTPFLYLPSSGEDIWGEKKMEIIKSKFPKMGLDYHKS